MIGFTLVKANPPYIYKVTDFVYTPNVYVNTSEIGVQKPAFLGNLTSEEVQVFYNGPYPGRVTYAAATSPEDSGVGIAALDWLFPTSGSINKVMPFTEGYWSRLKIDWIIKRHTIEMVYRLLTSGDSLGAFPSSFLGDGSSLIKLVPVSGACDGQLLEFTNSADYYSGIAHGIVFPMVSTCVVNNNQ